MMIFLVTPIFFNISGFGSMNVLVPSAAIHDLESNKSRCPLS